MMKYTEIEFENQPVVIPLYVTPPIKEDVIEELIQPTDILTEQRISSVFKGFLIPPTGIWRAASDAHADVQPSKTNVLKKASITKLSKSLKSIPLKSYRGLQKQDRSVEKFSFYLQDVEDYPHLYFTKEQAEFLRLMECIRKYAMESEAGSTEYTLWPVKWK